VFFLSTSPADTGKRQNNEELFTISSWGLHVGGVCMKPMKGGEQLL
jgi:hypothetical protein